MEQWIIFAQERWLLIIIALVVLWIIVKIVNSAIKWLLIIAILAGLWFYGSNYTDQLKDVGANLLNYTKSEAIEAMFGESQDAKYEDTGNGSYRITTKSFTLEGKLGSSEATLSFKGQSITIQLNDAIEQLIEDVRKQSGSTGA